jgi:hypothetical protein
MSSEPDDLLSKADALMARSHPGRAPAAPYAEIPVLDEVVDFLPESGDLPLLTEVVIDAPLDDEQIEAMVESIRSSLLSELQPRIDALIDQRLSDDLAPMVERMFDGLRGELQTIAHEILGDAIQSAVEQELEKRKTVD